MTTSPPHPAATPICLTHYVENAASAITLAVTDDRAGGRVYNIAEPEVLTEAVQRKWDARQHSIADSTRIRHDLGYKEHVALSEAIHRTIAWERAHPPDQANWPEFNNAAEDEALSRTP